MSAQHVRNVVVVAASPERRVTAVLEPITGVLAGLAHLNTETETKTH